MGMDLRVLKVCLRHAPRVKRMVGGPPGVGAFMDPRLGLMDGRRSPALRWGLVAIGLLALLVVAACDSGSAEDDPTSTSNSSNPTTSTPASTTTTIITSTTTTPDPSGEVLAAWDAFWEGWATVRASDDLDRAPLEAVADSEVVDGAVALFERQRESGLGAVETEVVTHPKVTEVASAEAMVEDCVLLAPSFTESVGVWYQADLRDGGSGWIVADLRILAGGGCVPEEMAREAIAAYGSFYDGWTSFWDPADPLDPLIGEVLAEPQLSLVVGLLEEHEARGVALRGQPTTHPEVIEVRSPSELVILSCLEPDPDYGLYDLETGERLPDGTSVREGQRNLESAVMVLENGKWKVSDLQGQVDFECEFAPTERGLPSV
jgi:hypothetical protein